VLIRNLERTAYADVVRGKARDQQHRMSWETS
jgi:hypothetical protein